MKEKKVEKNWKKLFDKPRLDSFRIEVNGEHNT